MFFDKKSVHIYIYIYIFFFCRFDKRITEFAEQKFSRNGIDVKTGYKVVAVGPESIKMQKSAVGEVQLPYGMAVWSTGIGTRPLISEFMKQIGQVNLLDF